jgi:hypothetical protein
LPPQLPLLLPSRLPLPLLLLAQSLHLQPPLPCGGPPGGGCDGCLALGRHRTAFAISHQGVVAD